MSTIDSLFGSRGIRRYVELLGEGITFNEIQEALAEKVIYRPVFSNKKGAVPGVFVSHALNFDPDKLLIVGTFVTGGVFAGHTAARRQGWSTSLSGDPEMHVRVTYTRCPKELPVKTIRSRNPEMLTLDVEHDDTEFGTCLSFTGPARTVVEILHRARKTDRDLEHGYEIIGDYFKGGGEPGAVIRIADDLKLNNGEWITRLVNSVHAGTRFGRSDDEQEARPRHR